MKLNSTGKKRLNYAIVFVILLFIEVFIALYVHDAFVRPYMGDALVVILIYAGIRIIVPYKCRLLPVYIFIFAASIEGMQYFDLGQRLGLQNNTFLRIVIGSVFDVKDIICYAVGCILIGIYELLIIRR